MLSYKCTAACQHCMYACSPRWDADWLSPADLERGLAQLAPHIQPAPWGAESMSLNYGLHFTGGEPFVNYELLLAAVQIAEEVGIPSTFVETNGYWCRDDKTARERLTELRAAGLHGIMISVNPFYAEYVPFERSERCIEWSQRVFGQNVMVYQLEYYRRFKQLGIRDRLSLDEYRALTGETVSRQAEFFLQGRAATSQRHAVPAHPARRFFGAPCRPAFLRSWHNHFDNYGHYLPGYCGGISLGSWLELDQTLQAGIDPDVQPVLALLAAEDVEGLLGFARARGYVERAEGYVSKCDLCLDLRRYLVAQGDYPELAPRAFYERLDDR
jgi:hypothetical protein